MKKYALWLLLVSSSPVVVAQSVGGDATDDAVPDFIPEVTIFGEPVNVTRIPGAATQIDAEDILRFNQSDIQRILRQVPGVSIQIEDGFGLRPNISIRGTASERSSRVTLLEDGILIAPAPYSAPAAYYFPTAGRLSAVEVLKGPAAIIEGPYTIGGAVNMLSTPIPEDRGGLVNVQAGEDATYRLHAHYGSDEGPIGWLVETHQWESDGFQRLDTGEGTGLSKQDYMLKLGWDTDGGAPTYHSVDLKLQYAAEDSDQSYLGLTDADFAATPVRRYGFGTLDNIDTEHTQAMLRHVFRNDTFEIQSTLYYNEFARNWFKTEEYDITGSPNAEAFNGVTWFQFIQAVNAGNSIGPDTAADLQAILNGANTPDGAIQIRANDREYYSAGLEVDFRWTSQIANTTHSFSAGVRRHVDHEERLQRNSTYTQIDGTLVLDDLGLLGNAGNAEQDADVWAIWLRDEIDFGRLQLSPGFRYEIIDQDRTRWETRPGFTTDPSSRQASNIRDQRRNDIDVLIPGIGFVYSLADDWSMYGGVHKGFSAPTNAPDVDEEESINYELGLRFVGRNTLVDAGLFLTDYDNLVGTCTASSGVDCDVGDAFNGDAATVAGLELGVGHTFYAGNDLRIPVQLTYTYIDGEFDSDIADTDFFGAVSAGDPLPYIPENQGLISVGLESDRWGAFASMNFVDETCVRASCGVFERTESSTLFDVSAYYAVSERATITATVENVTDEADIVGRTPYGARANKARTAMVGIRFEL
ncbi:MAG: TonB-dependent receptor [Pseudomonadota bacterium]